MRCIGFQKKCNDVVMMNDWYIWGYRFENKNMFIWFYLPNRIHGWYVKINIWRTNGLCYFVCHYKLHDPRQLFVMDTLWLDNYMIL